MINIIILISMVTFGVYLRYFSDDEALKGIIASISVFGFPIIMFIFAMMKKRSEKNEDGSSDNIEDKPD